jgi:hypothetical protein
LVFKEDSIEMGGNSYFKNNDIMIIAIGLNFEYDQDENIKVINIRDPHKDHLLIDEARPKEFEIISFGRATWYDESDKDYENRNRALIASIIINRTVDTYKFDLNFAELYAGGEMFNKITELYTEGYYLVESYFSNINIPGSVVLKLLPDNTFDRINLGYDEEAYKIRSRLKGVF